MSVTGAWDMIPYCEAVRTWCATLAAFKRALLGTQPVQVQSPPMRSFSTSATLAPSCTANPAAIRPPAPAPMITKSYCCFDIHVFLRFSQIKSYPPHEKERDDGHRKGAVDQSIDSECLPERCCKKRTDDGPDAQEDRINSHCRAAPRMGSDRSGEQGESRRGEAAFDHNAEGSRRANCPANGRRFGSGMVQQKETETHADHRH